MLKGTIPIVIAVAGVFFVAGDVVAGECEPCDQARSLMEEGKCDEALPILKKAAKKHKDSIEIPALQTVCHTAVDKRKNAAKSLEAFLKLRPTARALLQLRSTLEDHESPTPKVKAQFDLPAGTSPPIPILAARPIPSREAREFGVGGAVVVEGVLRADGKMHDMQAKRQGDYSGHVAFGFEEAAIASLAGWRYFPALRDGEPTPVHFVAIVQLEP